MANVNKVILIGRLTSDPELKFTAKGTAVANVSLAVNRFVAARDGGENREEVCFVPVTVWGKQAEALAEYMKKGRELYVEGRLQLDQWEDGSTGEKRSRLKVVAERVQFLGGGPSKHQEAEPPEPAEPSAEPGKGSVPF